MITPYNAIREISSFNALNRVESLENYAVNVLTHIGFNYDENTRQFSTDDEGALGNAEDVAQVMKAYDWISFEEVYGTEYKRSVHTKLKLYSMPTEGAEGFISVSGLFEMMKTVIELSDVISMDLAARLLTAGATPEDVRKALAADVDVELLASTLTGSHLY